MCTQYELRSDHMQALPPTELALTPTRADDDNRQRTDQHSLERFQIRQHPSAYVNELGEPISQSEGRQNSNGQAEAKAAVSQRQVGSLATSALC